MTAAGWILQAHRAAHGLVYALLITAPAFFQTATAPEVKAAFIFNFAKFSEWPADALPAGAPIVLCVSRDGGIETSLQSIVKGQTVEGHEPIVRHQPLDATGRSCHVWFAAGLDTDQATHLIELLKDAPVLTVSDVEPFASLGGVAQFFEKDGKIRFAVNLEAAHRAHLRLSSRLLHLARIVKDARSIQPR